MLLAFSPLAPTAHCAERAISVELLLRDIITALGPNRRADAAAELFGLAPGTAGLPLGERRQIASITLDVSERTVARSWEPQIINDIAIRLIAARRAPEQRHNKAP